MFYLCIHFLSLKLFSLLKHYWDLISDAVFSEGALIFILFYFFCISWCQKLFRRDVGYGDLQCYFHCCRYSEQQRMGFESVSDLSLMAFVI